MVPQPPADLHMGDDVTTDFIDKGMFTFDWTFEPWTFEPWTLTPGLWHSYLYESLE